MITQKEFYKEAKNAKDYLQEGNSSLADQLQGYHYSLNSWMWKDATIVNIAKEIELQVDLHIEN
jgi:hypothetical protein